MEDTAPNTSKEKKHDSQVAGKHVNPSKFYNHFLFKASLLVFFLVVVPLFTSDAPDFINQTRSWEVLQLIFVGIAVSYGLFSKKSDDTDKENSTNKFDNAQSYVSGLLQVSSVFDDETETQEENKVETWNNQYRRGEPVVVVAKENQVGPNENTTVSTRIGEKPLLLPIRSLKSRVLDSHDTVEQQSNHKTSLSSSKNSLEENVVRPSPIPWRSRSFRMEMKDDGEKSNAKEEPGVNKIEPFSLRSQSIRSPTPKSSTSPSPKNLSPSSSFSSSRKNMSSSLSFSSESQSKIGEDVVRKRSFRKSAPAPPPPPPPPPHFFYKNSPLMKSSSSVKDDKMISYEKELKRSIRSVPMESTGNEKFQLPRKAYSGTEFKPFIGSTRMKECGEDFIAQEVEETFVGNDKMIHESYNFGAKPTFMEFPQEDKKEYVEKFFEETDQEDSETESEDDFFEENSEETEFASQDTTSEGVNDGGPDVDKKADEFIAKFREQIRLQRIESIRKSAGQPARTFVR